MKIETFDHCIATLAAHLAGLAAVFNARPDDTDALLDALDGLEEQIGEFRKKLFTT